MCCLLLLFASFLKKQDQSYCTHYPTICFCIEHTMDIFLSMSIPAHPFLFLQKPKPFGWPWSCSSFFAITRWRSRTTSLPVPLRRRWWTWIRSFSWGRRAPVGSGAGSSLIEKQIKHFIKRRNEADHLVNSSKNKQDL